MNRFFGPVPITRRPFPVALFDGEGNSVEFSPAAALDDDDDEDDVAEEALEGGLKVYAVGALAPLPAR